MSEAGALTEMSVDPIAFEIISRKLWQILKEAGYALARVSGSPVVTDVGEHMECFYDADGNCTLAGGGITSHIMSGSFAIKHVIREYEEDLGIHDGDHFFLNDPYIASLHNADMFILTPIFYEGKRIAWTACATHTVECGGINPGGMSPSATEIYHDGLRFPGIKIVERGVFRKDVLAAIKNMVRVPDIVALDTVAKIAGCNVAASKLLSLVGRYGPELVGRVFQELIRFSEYKARVRLREMPDGVWRARTYIDHNGQEDVILRVLLTMTKEGDHLTFDFTGTDPQSRGCVNSSLNATLSGLFTPLASVLFHNIPWNQGLINPVSLVVPKGCLLNPNLPASVTGGVPGGGVFAVLDSSTQTIAKMLAVSKYPSDATAPWRAGSSNSNLTGLNQYRQGYATMVSDGLAGGTGAGVDRDGCSTGGAMVNPQTIIANIEVYERAYPIRWLYRRQAVDSCGHGRHRGGLGGELAIELHDAPGPQRQVFFGRGKEPALAVGIFGAYPANSSFTAIVKGANLEESAREGNVTPGYSELSGEVDRLPTKCQRVLAPGDVQYSVWEGGGGYGDPLERDPALVRRDVVQSCVSNECAERIYGVVVDAESVEVDLAATEQRRNELRAARLAKGRPGPRLSQERRPVPLGRKPYVSHESRDSIRMAEYLEIVGKGEVRCTVCQTVICLSGDNYKEHVLFDEKPLTSAGAWRSETSRFVLREFYCPGCATMLEVEMAAADDPVLWDVCLKT